MDAVSNVLVVDVGNTNVVIGIYRAEVLVASWRLATARDRTDDEYGILARQFVNKVTTDPIDGAIVASVVPPLNSTVARMIEGYFGIHALFVEPGIKTGVALKVENPLEVGADRIVNAAAAFEIYGGPSIIVDFGTATTFDVIGEKGEFLGGVIAPGLTISSEALFARAARLPRIDIKRPAHVIGTNTVTNLQSGIYFGYLGLVDGILARMKQELGPQKIVMATGGLAPLLADDSEHIEGYDADLTLKGLKIIYDRNQVSGRSRRR